MASKTAKQAEAARVILAALEAIQARNLHERLITYGQDAHTVAKHLGLELRATRNLLSLAERAGAVRSITLRCWGTGRKNTKQQFMRKFYQVVR